MAFDEEKFARYGLLAGVATAVLFIVSGFIAGSPPMVSDTDKEIQKYIIDNQDALKISSYLGGLAALTFLWFLGSLYGRLRASEGGNGRLSRVAMMSGVVGLSVALAGNALAAHAALRPSFGLWRLANQFYGFTGFAIAVFVAAVSVLIWSSGLLPKWFGYAGEAIAVAFLIGAASVATENDTIAIVGFVAFIAWSIWLAVLSVQLYRKDA
ncbi:MAG: hypothetical protein WD598_09650 [Acidimicrobiia bacterium]